jgi:hypothetical protein
MVGVIKGVIGISSDRGGREAGTLPPTPLEFLEEIQIEQKNVTYQIL